MGVVLKRALYFITCSGRTLYPIRMNEDFITNRIIGVEALNWYQIEHHDSYRQLSLFDDFTWIHHHLTNRMLSINNERKTA